MTPAIIDQAVGDAAAEAAGVNLEAAIVKESCPPCSHGKEHGWWGNKTLPKGAGTHCSSCHVSWPGSQRWGHCAKCHNTFSGVRAFDVHLYSKNCPPVDPNGYPSEEMKYVIKTHDNLGFDYYGSADTWTGPEGSEE